MTVLLAALALLQTGYAKPAGWVDQTLAEGIKVSSPRPLRKDKADKGDITDSWTDDSGPVTYSFELTKPGALKGNSSSELLTSYLEGAQAELDGQVDGEKDLLAHGWPGTALTLIAGKATVCIRCYAISGRVAAIMCTFGTSAKRPPSVDQFLDSIQFQKTGPATVAGPEMKRYPLGKSGITMLFPGMPAEASEPVTDNKKGPLIHSFTSEYCLRNMVASYIEFSPNDIFPAPAEIPKFYKDALDGINEEIKGKTTLEREIAIGPDKGLYRELSIADSTVAYVATVLHKNLSVNLIVVAPRAYSDRATLEAFFKSVEFTDTESSEKFDLRSQVSDQKAGEWVEQTFDGFKASAPISLAKLDLNVLKSQGMPAGMHMWAGKSEDMAYVVIVAKIPPEPGKSPVANMTDYLEGMIRKDQLKIDEMKNIVQQGWPGISLVAEKSGSQVIERSFFVADSVVDIVATRPPSGDPSRAMKFLDSLRLPSDGAATSPDPAMKRYDLGDSGISAIFPDKPDKRDDTNKVMGRNLVTHSFGSPYALRAFVVSYLEIPAEAPMPTDQEMGRAYSEMLDEVTTGLQGKKTKERDMSFGADVGLYREVGMPNGFTGLLAVVMHKKKIAVMMAIGPSAYKDQTSIDAFFKSLQFKD